MTKRNTVHISSDNPSTETQFILYGADLTAAQIQTIEGILSKTEQEILRFLRTQQVPARTGGTLQIGQNGA